MPTRKTQRISLVAVTLAIGMLAGCHGGTDPNDGDPSAASTTPTAPATPTAPVAPTDPATPTAGESTNATTPNPTPPTPGATSTTAAPTPTKPPATNANAVRVTAPSGWTLHPNYYIDGSGYGYFNTLTSVFGVKLFDAWDTGRLGLIWIESVRQDCIESAGGPNQHATSITTRKVDGRTAWEFTLSITSINNKRYLYIYDAPNTYEIVCGNTVAESWDALAPVCESMIASITIS